MDTINLALVMAPNLLPFTATATRGHAYMTTASTFLGHEQCLEASTSVVKILIEHCDQIGLVPEGVAFVAMELEEKAGPDYKWKDVFAARSCETPDGLG